MVLLKSFPSLLWGLSSCSLKWFLDQFPCHNFSELQDNSKLHKLRHCRSNLGLSYRIRPEKATLLKNWIKWKNLVIINVQETKESKLNQKFLLELNLRYDQGQLNGLYILYWYQQLISELWPGALQDPKQVRSLPILKWSDSSRFSLKKQKIWLMHFEWFLITKIKTIAAFWLVFI